MKKPLLMVFIIFISVSLSADSKADLIQAVRDDDMVGVNTLIAQGADVNARYEDDRTALMIAAWYGYIEIIYLLNQAGAELDARDTDGWTALMHASYNGHVEAVTLLVQFGADVTVENNDGQTAKDLAANTSFKDAIVIILEQANP
jgi:ankyrin repeat protein